MLVSYVSDGGGVVRAARRRVIGADRVARLLIGVRRKAASGISYVAWNLNGGPGYLVLNEGQVRAAVALDVGEAGIRAIYNVLNPAKLLQFSTGRRLELA
jgi:RNA polymerase sigma-70 factor, ECF subfamily